MLMKKSQCARLQDIIGILNGLYSPALAEDWDNVGLQVGDPLAMVDRVLVCLDPSEKALDAAVDAGAQAILTHHPLIFRPLKSVTPSDETGRLLFRAIREGVAILCAHTNLDRARNGLNDWLAQRLGICDARPLSGGGEGLVKIVVFVPDGHEDTVAQALFEAGAGHIGRYDRCSFRTEGTGTFRPGSGTSPFLGKEGETESAREWRMETIVPRERLNRAVSRMIKAHPYEEVAYDLYPLANAREDIGLGRIGNLANPISLHDFALFTGETLESSTVRFTGDPDAKICKAAICGGSGGSLIDEAFRKGADVLVTGDIKYHEARKAESLGLSLVDAGHFATERIAARELAHVLRRKTEDRNLAVDFLELKEERDPFQLLGVASGSAVAGK